MGFSSESTEQARVKWLMQNQRFRNWFQAADSQLLVIKIQEAGQLATPLSVFCSMLLMSLHDVSHVFSIYYFCGNARTTEGDRPHSLLRALISQLVAQIPYEAGFLTIEHVQKIGESNPDYLWDLLKTLVLSPQSATVFCVIDGLSYYHNRAEAFLFIQGCNRLIQDPSSNFKLLLTGPVPREINSYVPRSDIMFMPNEVEVDGQGLNMRQAQILIYNR